MAAELESGAAAGWLRPVISHEYPLSSAAEAHREVMEHTQGSSGKIVLTVWRITFEMCSNGVENEDSASSMNPSSCGP